MSSAVDNSGVTISRREVLLSAAAGLVGGCMGVEAQWNAPARPSSQGTRWAMLSDVHIDASRKTWWNGSNPAENLRAVVEQVLADRPQHVLVAGDVSFQDGRPADYATFHELIEPLVQEKLPLTYMLGNHDRRDSLISSLHENGASPVAGKWVFE